MSFRLTPAAEQDLGEILGYVAEHASPNRADQVLTEVFRAAELLGESARIGHRRDDLTDEAVLFWPVIGLLLVDLPEDRPITIVRVMHGSRASTVMRELLRGDS
ncbi:MAG: hypothetical protein DHS20C15_33260 [Planctomycetota bacterium]|nr:MAG: hypothetical protein DHS20C15_33260 [Planctomycetota bacterium]